MITLFNGIRCPFPILQADTLQQDLEQDHLALTLTYFQGHRCPYRIFYFWLTTLSLLQNFLFLVDNSFNCSSHLSSKHIGYINSMVFRTVKLLTHIYFDTWTPINDWGGEGGGWGVNLFCNEHFIGQFIIMLSGGASVKWSYMFPTTTSIQNESKTFPVVLGTAIFYPFTIQYMFFFLHMQSFKWVGFDTYSWVLR